MNLARLRKVLFPGGGGGGGGGVVWRSGDPYQPKVSTWHMEV